MSHPLDIQHGLVAWCDPSKDPATDGVEVKVIDLKLPAAILAAVEAALLIYDDARPSSTSRSFAHGDFTLGPDQEIVVVQCDSGEVRLHFPGVLPRMLTVTSALVYWRQQASVFLEAHFLQQMQQQAASQQLAQRILAVVGKGMPQ